MNTPSTDMIIECLSLNARGHILAGYADGFLSGGGGIMRSTDDGDTWTDLNLGIPGVDAWEIVSAPPGNLLAACSAAGILRSSDDGDTWAQVNNGLTDISVMSVGVIPSGELFVGTETGEIFTSMDNGDHWLLSHTDEAAAVNHDRLEEIVSGGLCAGGRQKDMFELPSVRIDLENSCTIVPRPDEV